MKRLFLTTMVFVASVAGQAQAGEPMVGTRIGTEPVQIAAALEKDGFKMVEFEREHGRIEVKAARDGGRIEIHVDPTSGEITGIQDDD